MFTTGKWPLPKSPRGSTRRTAPAYRTAAAATAARKAERNFKLGSRPGGFRLHRLQLDAQLVDPAQEVTKEPLAHRGVAVEHPLHGPAPDPVGPGPELLLHEVLQAHAQDPEAGRG